MQASFKHDKAARVSHPHMIKNMATELNFFKMFLICLKFICLGFFAEIGKEALKGYFEGLYFWHVS